MEINLGKEDNFYQKTIVIILKLTILFIPLILYKYVDYFRANQEAWLKLFILMGIFLYFFRYLRQRKFNWKNNELNLPLIFFMLVMGLSFFKNYSIMISLSKFSLFFAYLFLYFLIINNIENESQFNEIIRFFFFVSSLTSLYIILHYYGIIPYLREYGPVISPIGQKNWTSNYLALIFPLMFCFFLLEENKKGKKIYFIFLSIIYAALMICQSRSIWISLGLTLTFGIYLIYRFKLLPLFYKNKKWLIVLLSIFLIITVIYSTDNPLNKSPLTVTQRALSTFDEKDPSINTRFLIWKNTLQMIKDRPFLGGGLGDFGMNYLNYQAKFLRDNPQYIKYWTNAKEAHNEYLQMGAEMGLLGLGIFIAILFIFYNLVLKFLKEEKDGKKKLVCWGLMGGITCFLIHCFFTFPLHVHALGSAFFIILGLTVVYIKNFNLPERGNKEGKKDCSTNREKNVENKKSNSFRLNLLCTILILLIMLLLIDTIVIRPYLAEVYAYKGRDNLEEGNYTEALNDFEYAIKLDPYNGRILINLGATYINLDIYNEAEKVLKRSKKYYNDLNTYWNLGLCYMKLERVQEAEGEFQQAIYLNPKFTEVYHYLGLLYFQQGDYNGAIEQWNKILETEPNFPNKYIVLNNLGIVYNKKEIPDKALEYFLKALQLAPEGSPIEEEIEEEINKIYKSNLKN